MSADGPSADPVRADDFSNRSMAMFERETRSAGSARRWLREFLDDLDVPEDLQSDAALIISELVTNALRHGLGEIVARAEVGRDGSVSVAVTDSGSEHPQMQPVDFERVGGVGLHVVEQISVDWGVSPFPGGKTVWATIAAAAR